MACRTSEQGVSKRLRTSSGSIREIFGGGVNGERMAVTALEFFDGKREPKTAEELTLAMAFESATFNIRTHLRSEMQAAPDEGSLAVQLVKQLTEK